MAKATLATTGTASGYTLQQGASVTRIPSQLADLFVSVDLADIAAQLSRRAILSKGKRATALKGAIVVSARNARPIA